MIDITHMVAEFGECLRNYELWISIKFSSLHLRIKGISENGKNPQCIAYAFSVESHYWFLDELFPISYAIQNISLITTRNFVNWFL